MYTSIASSDIAVTRFLGARAWIMYAGRKNEEAMLMYTRHSYGDLCTQYCLIRLR